MAQNDLWKRYLDAGLQFTQMTQARAEAIVRDLVRAGEVQAEQTQALVNEMVDRSRMNTERLLETIRKEVRSQIAPAEAARKDMVDRLEGQINDLRAQVAGRARSAGTAGKKAAKKKAAGAKKQAKKSAAAAKKPGKKAAAKKPAKQKAAKKKSAAKKAAE